MKIIYLIILTVSEKHFGKKYCRLIANPPRFSVNKHFVHDENIKHIYPMAYTTFQSKHLNYNL